MMPTTEIPFGLWWEAIAHNQHPKGGLEERERAGLLVAPETRPACVAGLGDLA